MTPLRPVLATFDLPALQRVRETGPAMPRVPHRSILLRGGLVLAALALPALGIRAADRRVARPGAGASQAAAIPRTAPGRVAAFQAFEAPR